MKSYKAEIKLKGIGDLLIIEGFRATVDSIKEINLEEKILLTAPKETYTFAPGTILYIKLTEVKE